ncbi:response regulator [Euzebyella marina]|uniref:histidine kinase n=1 Tax=Euzebyella marina TaxID=1761453 RepID=A0A3G2L6H4_9FLAO|nr:response regulator [Euzebyella marina]AYN67803.1 response regulator [Euzebyella marina]
MKVIRLPTIFAFFLFASVAISQEQPEWQLDTLQSYVDRSNQAYDVYQYKDAIKYASLLIEKGKEFERPVYEFLGYDILGGIYTETDDSIQGKIYSEKALALARTIGKDSLIAWGTLNLGILYSENKNTYHKAIQYFEESIAINEKLGDYNEIYLTYVNLIWTHLDNNAPEKAYQFLQKAEALSGKQIDSLNKMYIDLLYGRYYLTQKNYTQARLKLEKIASLADEDAHMDLALEAYENLAKLYSATYNYENAFKNLDKYHNYKQKAYTLKKLEETEKARAKFELAQAQKNLQVALKEQEYSDELISKSRSLTTVLIIAIAILVMSLIGVVIFFRTRKKYITNLQIKNQELEIAREKAEKLSKVKTKFLSTVSHELRTPLYGVIGISSLLKEDENLKEYSEDLDALKFSADYLLALINDVLLLSKMDADAITLSKVPYEMNALLKNILRSFETSLQQNGNQLHLEIDDRIPNKLIGDPVRLSQVLINLVGNAIKFTENGNIWLELKLVKKSKKDRFMTEFVVKDDGPGIPLDKQGDIFKEFTQIENKNHSYKGTGLGLTIVKKILKLYGSKISLESAPGKGAKFTFNLNLRAYEPTAPYIPKNSSSLNGKERANEASVKHVLIVDDNKINQKVTKKTLEKHQIKSTLADDGAEALEICKESKFDLILMDIHMPNMNGMEATRHIRKFDKNIPILALTAVELDENKTEIINSGINDIIHKPYNLPEFLDTVFKYLYVEETNSVS